MYTLTLAYIHENNYFGKIGTNHHYAWYHMNTAFGPAVGMLIGGQFSKVWVDWYDKTEAAPDDISIDSKLWVGTWWIGYWISGLVTFSLGIFIMLFVPEKLKTRNRLKDDIIVKTQSSSSKHFLPRQSRSDIFGASTSSTRSLNHARQSRSYSHGTAVSGTSYIEVFDNPENLGQGHDWADLFGTYKRLVSNFVFVGIAFACTFDMGFVSVISMYGLIYLSEIYNIPQDTASLIFSASLATVMFALPGSSFATRNVDTRTKADIKWTMQLIRILAVCSGICCLGFFMSCNDSTYRYVGGNANFDEIVPASWQTTSDHDGFDGFNPQLYGTCSRDSGRECKCTPQEYSPICANITMTDANSTSWKEFSFFSPCHLGCEVSPEIKLMKLESIYKQGNDVQNVVKNCKCLDPSTNFRMGACSTYNCDWRIYFIITSLVLSCFFTFFQVVPGTLITQAIVPDHLRSVALGANALLYRVFGTIPMPLIAAKIIDSQCLWWSTTCQKEKGACRAFDKYGLSSSFVTILFLLKAFNVIAYSFGICYVDQLTHLKDKATTRKK